MKKTMTIYLVIGIAVITLCGILLHKINKSEQRQEVSEGVVLYVGTYGDKLYRYIFDIEDNSFTPLECGKITNPSYVALGKENRKDGLYDVYAVSECGDSSSVVSFADNIRMSETGSCDTIGDDPCHLVFDPENDILMTAEYTGGSVSAFMVNDDGSVGKLLQNMRFSGSGPVSGRQESSHIHQITFLPVTDTASVQYVLATDLGADKVRVIALDGSGEDGPLLEHCPSLDIECGAGSGPRHIALSEGKERMYCLTELSGELLFYEIGYDGAGVPSFTLRQRVQADKKEAAGSADVHISPDGRFLYASHRLKNDGISIYSIESDGTLSEVGYCKTGRHPRNFSITPDGSKMLVACRDDRAVEVYDIDSGTGLLTYSGSRLRLKTDMPSCVVIPE